MEKVILFKVIDQIRVPLICMVVLIHSNFSSIISNSDFVCYNYLSQFLSDIVSSLAVPTFFMLSGFLFFVNMQKFNGQHYIIKIKKRFSSLFVPYVAWNLITAFFFFIGYIFAGNLMSGKTKPVIDWSFIDWILSFVDTNLINSSKYGISSPICAPLWYIRNLICVVLISPFLYFIIKYSKGFILVVLIFLSLFTRDYDAILTLHSITYFSIGIFFAIKQIDFSVFFSSKSLPIAIIFYLVICLISVRYNFLIVISTIIGVALLPSIIRVSIIKYNLNISHSIIDSVFFIYAFHQIPLSILIKLSIKYFPANSFTYICIYIFSCTVIVVAGYYIYITARRIAPRIISVLTGGR